MDNWFYRIQGISLKWKLLIPFLFFAFTGTTTMAYIGLTSQQNLIHKEEKKEIIRHYRNFVGEIGHKETQVRSLSIMISQNPQVQSFFAHRNRGALLNLLKNTYEHLQENFNINCLHFHSPVARSFLRVHRPAEFGEDMKSFRKTIVDAIQKRAPVSGLELGAIGFAIRGVSPVFHNGEVVGTVEVGHTFGEAFLKNIQERWDIDVALYEIKGEGVYIPMAKSRAGFKAYFISDFLATTNREDKTILIAPDKYPNRSILWAPVRDYSERKVALVEISIDRSEIQARLKQTRNIMVLVGLLGITISFFLTFLVASLFIKPIKEIVNEAQDIAHGKRESRLEPLPNDEMGKLTQALNTMLAALKKRRLEIENHAKDLEARVRERTADLVDSMENYRTLVENVPLIVYRLLPDGTTEFINSNLTESLGYSIEEAVSDRSFWMKNILGSDRDSYPDFIEQCLNDGKECRVERRVHHKNGHSLIFIDHAIPTKDEKGNLERVDGIMMDITELKELQERALCTEEMRILGDISARIAHEIRNPLASAGGFARRLVKSLPQRDKNRKLAQIIVEEVSRLEDFLRILLSSISPFELSLEEVDINTILGSLAEQLKGISVAKNIEIVEQFTNGALGIQADEERLRQAFENILKHAIISMQNGDQLFLSTESSGGNTTVTLRHKGGHISDDDFEQFFYPHMEERTDSDILELPLSKIIIHRHGGKVDLSRDGGEGLVLTVVLPNIVFSEDEL